MKILHRLLKPVLLLLIVMMLGFLPAGQTEAAVNVITKAKAGSLPEGEIKENSKGIRYRYKNGTYAKNKWLLINGKIYYFSSSRYAGTGWFTYQKNTYYADENGIAYYGKWVTLNDKKYYLKKDGTKAHSEWVKMKGKYYYFDKNGVMARNCQVAGKSGYYYVGADGARQTSCWVTIKKNRYYFGKNGIRCQSKWVKYKGKYYYLKKNGKMAVNCWVGSYYVGSDGARMTSCCVDGYYLNALGQKTKAKKFSGKYLIVGDSRVVGMAGSVVSSQTKFIGKVSMGYSWLKSTAGSQAEQYLAGNQKLKVVFAFGVNDLGNIAQYISYYRSLMSKYPDSEFYFMSVNPVNEQTASASGYRVTNAPIKTFNTKLKNAFGTKYLDTYSYLTKNGFGTVDGIHYTAATYQKLYKYILNKIA